MLEIVLFISALQEQTRTFYYYARSLNRLILTHYDGSGFNQNY